MMPTTKSRLLLVIIATAAGIYIYKNILFWMLNGNTLNNGHTFFSWTQINERIETAEKVSSLQLTQTTSNGRSQSKSESKPQPQSQSEGKSRVGVFLRAAVADDVDVCAEVGTYLLRVRGGSAVDAAIAVALCNGVVNPHNSGIGGGFLMLVHDRIKGESRKTTKAFNARERGPQYATPELPDIVEQSGQIRRFGALNIAVPMEIYGYGVAHQMFGRLPWAELFEPAIAILKNGFKVRPLMEYAIKGNLKILRAHDNNLRHWLTKEDGSYVQTGDVVVDHALAATFERIAKNGYLEFYQGALAHDIVQDIREQGGNFSLADLQKVAPPEVIEPLQVKLSGSGRILAAVPPPSSGVTTNMVMEVMAGYNYTGLADIGDDEKYALFLHRFIMTYKLLFPGQKHLAHGQDPDAVKWLQRFTSSQYAAGIRELIDDDHAAKYDDELKAKVDFDAAKELNEIDDASTSHFNIYGPDGSMVTLTTSVGNAFGCKLKGTRTGIVFNNHVNEFVRKSVSPIASRYAGPDKFSTSSMSPMMLLDHNKKPVLGIGASGADRISPAIAMSLMMNQWFGMDIASAIDMPRVYFNPEFDFLYHDDFPQPVLDALKRRGHDLHRCTERYPYLGVIQAIDVSGCPPGNSYRRKPCVVAVSDYRKEGKSDGF